MTLVAGEITLADSLNTTIDTVGEALYGLRVAAYVLRQNSDGLEKFNADHPATETLSAEVATELVGLHQSNRQRLQAKVEASDAYRVATRSLAGIIEDNLGVLVRVEAIQGKPIEKIKFLPNDKDQILDTPGVIEGRLAYVRNGTNLWLSSSHKHFSFLRPHYVAHTLGANPYKRQVTFRSV